MLPPRGRPGAGRGGAARRFLSPPRRSMAVAAPPLSGVAGGRVAGRRRFAAGRVAPFLLAPVAPVAPLPDLDVAVVLLEGRGEDVGAVVAADEVEVGDVGRRAPRPPGWRGRASRSAPAAGRRSGRCCRANRAAGRRDGGCRPSGPGASGRRSPWDRRRGRCGARAGSVDGGDERPLGGELAPPSRRCWRGSPPRARRAAVRARLPGARAAAGRGARSARRKVLTSVPTISASRRADGGSV